MPRQCENWVSAYMDYTAENESPEIYHRWTAIATIAGALRRRVWFPMRYFDVYPNNYIVLTGPPGIKKSTAMNIGRRLQGRAGVTKFVVDSTSRERLIQDMSKVKLEGNAAMTSYSSELGSLLTTSEMDMVVFLIEAYDSGDEFEHRTRGGGELKIEKPSLNILACTTPDWLSTGLPLQTMGIGLVSRIIFAFENQPRGSYPFPDDGQDDTKTLAALTGDLQDIAQMAGQMSFDAEAKVLYRQWYESRHGDLQASDPRLAGYYSRKPVHVIKTCMSIAASRHSSLVMTPEDLKEAFSMLETVESRLPKAFEATGKNPLRLDYHHVQAAVENHPEGIGHRDLLKLFKHTVRQQELIEVLNTLVDIRAISRHRNGDGQDAFFPVKAAPVDSAHLGQPVLPPVGPPKGTS